MTTEANQDRMRLRVLTLNVWNTEGPAARQEQLRAQLQALDPDLVCLQEVVVSDDYDQLGFLLGGLGGLGGPGGPGGPGGRGGTGLHTVHDTEKLDGTTWGTAIATRWAPAHVETARLTHSEPGPTAIAAVVPLPIGVEMLFLGVKPAYKFTDEAARCRQALEITALEERLRQQAPTVIAGDFDAQPDHECMRYYTGRTPLDGRSVHFRDAWELAGDGGPGHTWTTANPWVEQVTSTGWIQAPHQRRIDYILLGSPEDHSTVLSKISSCRVVLNLAPIPSDHYGVLAEIELRSIR